MKLTKVHVTNFRSIEDTEFDVGDLTCLVGKNEAGKTGLLLAMNGLSPIFPFKYDRTRDYPRRYLTKFDERHEGGKSRVVSTTWKLDASDLKAVHDVFGEHALVGDTVEIQTGFHYDATIYTASTDDRACLDYLLVKYKLDAVERNILTGTKTCKEAIAALEAQEQRSAKLDDLLTYLRTIKNGRFSQAIVDIFSARKPSFFYTSHFDRMSGEISLNKLTQDIASNSVSKPDSIFIDFLRYAGTTIDELQEATQYEELKAKLEAASNDITEEIFTYWSQNDALQVVIDIGEGKSGDPVPFNSGTVVKIRIQNTNHKATVPLSERSAGFVWFFSFLAQFKQLKKAQSTAVLLLDEPGLTLHGKAQADLLRYIEDRLLSKHQVVYTTHSPFMVPTHRLDSVRIVEDVVVKDGRGRPDVKGTKVSRDALKVEKDTLFPLQGALGYDISQSLFIGKNVVLVEGASDILYLQIFSEALRKRGRKGLDPNWTLCPSGGIDKISPFVSLFGGNKIKIAVLTDMAKGDKGKLERLRRSDILQAGNLFSATDFVAQEEADVEDFLGPLLYTRLLNDSFNVPLALRMSGTALLAAEPTTPRLVKKAEALFRVMPAGVNEFNHYTPAEFLLRHPTILDGDAPEVVDSLAKFEEVAAALNACL